MEIRRDLKGEKERVEQERRKEKMLKEKIIINNNNNKELLLKKPPAGFKLAWPVLLAFMAVSGSGGLV